jgi:GDP/UDP-N,N'-diacetylbacillosamine 2-epimerase (hydrolysing)
MKAIELAQDEVFIENAKKTINPYGNGETSEKIVEIIKEYIINNKINLKKEFYNCGVV